MTPRKKKKGRWSSSTTPLVDSSLHLVKALFPMPMNCSCGAVTPAQCRDWATPAQHAVSAEGAEGRWDPGSCPAKPALNTLN